MNNNFNHDTKNYLFNLIGQYTDIKVFFESIIEWLEYQLPESLITVNIYSDSCQNLDFRNGRQNFSQQFCKLSKYLKIEPNPGIDKENCFTNKSITNFNLVDDPKCVFCHILIKAKKITNWWSIPIINTKGTVYGAFIIYYRPPKKPSEKTNNLIQQAGTLIALALEIENERQQKIAINEKYSSFYNYHPDAIFELDTQGFVLNTNIACKEITGFSEDQVKGKHYWAFIPKQYHELVNTAFEEALKGKAKHYEIPAFHVSGKIIWLDLTNLPIIQNQKITGMFAIANDITLRRENRERLRLLERGVNASSNGIFITDATEKMLIVYVNPAFLELTGYSEEDVLGQNCSFLQGSDTDPDQVAVLKKAVLERKEVTVTVKNYCKDGSWFWGRLMLGPVFDNEGICTHFLGIQEDITQQYLHEEYINYQNSHDHLTGLPNQTTFDHLLETNFLEKHNSTVHLYLLYIDLDDFGSMNESLGYLIGDKILKHVANRLQEFLKPEAILCRYIEDEFALLLTGQYTHTEITEIAQIILELTTQNFQIENQTLHLSASIGIASTNANVRSSSELLHHSIKAMKQAKKQGRNAWYWYEESHCKNTVENNYAYLRLELMAAVKSQQFELFYQPLVQPLTGNVKGVEALIRWHHPQQGYIFPDVFIPLAERTGQIILISQWVLKKACIDIATFNRLNRSRISVSVNISPLQFGRADFLEELKNALNISQLPPELLKIEITEGVIINGADRAVEILKLVRALGVQVAIDDFGTGYSSLSYLRQLPINQIKLDKSFIDNLTTNQQDEAITTSIIYLAQQLNLEVVAEGVETVEQAILLYQHKCDLLQGYFYARPAILENLQLKYTPLVETGIDLQISL
ncbi:sensor domain-containing protein [Acinetobacter schindleri]|uniref:sensor domain-containing protein n=1 Tax=Acinetobacter schindleri TaxID=108981 RepID=UPI0030FC6DEC